MVDIECIFKLVSILKIRLLQFTPKGLPMFFMKNTRKQPPLKETENPKTDSVEDNPNCKILYV